MKIKTICIALLLSVCPLSTMAAQTAKAVVLAGVKAVFIDRDADEIDRWFSPDYIQHNPNFPNGSGVLKGFTKKMPDNFKYQIGHVIADEETGMVALHFRAQGTGPKPMVGVDMFRVKNGKIVEHWDVLQEEVTETVSGNPMWSATE
ncbi:nuclear transport factor 2 family protein [Vibrio quintilis]|nr:nuclear transport factor 2 family protein [Vibrio quintilis]